MKKMISKKIVSLLAAAAMLITSTAVVLADNVTTSESGDQWGTAGSTVGCTHSVDDGILTSTRSVFRVDETVDGTKYNKFYHAVDGKWALHSEKLSTASWTGYPNVTETTWDVKTETSTGKAQVKFDFKFDGGVNQTFYAYFNGYAGQTGVRFLKTGMSPIWPNGTFGTKTVVNFEDDTWYTCIAVLDLDKAELSYSVKAQNGNSVLAAGSATIPDDKWGTNTKAAVTGIKFRSPVDQDKTDASATMQNSGDVAVAESVWHIANVEYDAYTETNYALNNVYKSTDGMVSNKESASIPFAGVGLTRLTKIADPSNLSLITASYDETTRMDNVAVTPLSSIATAPVHSAVTGNTVKSFIFDMNTANPFVDAYQYTEPTVTERSIDFNDGCSVATTNDKSTITTQGNYLNSTYGDVSVGIENGALKFERSAFRTSNTNYSWTENGAATSTVSSYDKAHYVVRLDETVSKVTGSLKFKFADLDHPDGRQHITVDLGSGTNAPGQYLIRIQRKPDGSGQVRNYFSGVMSWTTAEAMKADEWYTLDFTYDYNATNSLSVSITGDFGGTVTTKSWAGAANSNTTKATFDYVAIYSHYNDDYAFPASEVTTPTTGWSTKTSVWYIDDINVKY